MDRGKNMDAKISVIVPVYNGREYFSECIESILAQTYPNIELILVDDGSYDGVEQDCDRYGQLPNVKVIHKQNGGLQAARVTGIEAATGEYVGFVDADDWIEPDMYCFLGSNIKSSDIVTSGIFQHGKDGAVKKLLKDAIRPGKYDCMKSPLLENLFFSRFYDGSSGMVGAVLNNLVCKLFRADVAKKMFPLGNRGVRYGEDFLFLYHYLLACQSITVTDKIYYHYRMNPNSIVHRADDQFLCERSEIYHSLMDSILKHPMGDILKHQFQRRFTYELMPFWVDRMDLPQEMHFPRYIYPSLPDLFGRKIVLFGAGKVGRDYYFAWKNYNLFFLAMWVDTFQTHRVIHGCKIHHPSDIKNTEYDFILCAVLEKDIYEEIKCNLIQMGVLESKILWKQPRDQWLDYYQNMQDG